MKPRVLSYRVPATHDSITILSSITDPLSISDFDAFIFDPEGLRSDGIGAELGRRQRELQDLVRKKGGIVVCILRPDEEGSGNSGYSLLKGIEPSLLDLVMRSVRPGEGLRVIPVPAARGASAGYFQVLRGNLRFTAYLGISEPQVAQFSGTVFARDSVGYPLAAEFLLGQGVLSLVPPPHGVTSDRLGAAIAKTIATHFNKPTEIDAPCWTEEIPVPGAHVPDEQIANLRKQVEQLGIEISELENKKDELLNYRRLLFGYGKAVLEPVVRAGFRLLGFSVPEPEEYGGEWDFELRDAQAGALAIGEVEGSEGVIDVDKYRQLLDYIEAEALEDRDRKGILVGNGFRLLTPQAPERQQQFSEHAMRGAKRNGFCLLPTTELFEAVCAVLDSPGDEGLKIRIRESVLATVGVWSFTR